MKRVYRFSADLREKPPKPATVKDGVSVEDGEAERDRKLDAELGRVPPAELLPVEHEDPLDAQELLQAYNGSLKRTQGLACGRYENNGIDHHVFYDEWHNKHIITQPLGARGERVSEVIMGMDGNLLRYSLERLAGPPIDMQPLMLTGICDVSDAYLKTIPGYWLMTTRYYREGKHLVRVEQTQVHYSPQLGDFEHIEDVILG